MAPCSHTWHFKCVKSLLLSPNYPVFICPNCRAGADLEADVDEPTDWDPAGSGDDGVGGESASEDSKNPADPDRTHIPDTSDANDVTVAINASPDTPARSALPYTASAPLPIRNPSAGNAARSSTQGDRPSRTPSPPGYGPEGPITPRNDAGPWVFDGSAPPRDADANPGEMVSLDAAADMGTNGASSEENSREH